VIAHASFTLRPLASIVATAKLTPLGRRLLTKHETLQATLTVRTRAAGKPVKTTVRRTAVKTAA
jgi:hypothetical protein